MTERDYTKETKEDMDFLIKEATKECESSMYGTYDAADCICQRLKKFDWIDGKLFILAARKAGKDIINKNEGQKTRNC